MDHQEPAGVPRLVEYAEKRMDGSAMLALDWRWVARAHCVVWWPMQTGDVDMKDADKLTRLLVGSDVKGCVMDYARQGRFDRLSYVHEKSSVDSVWDPW